MEYGSFENYKKSISENPQPAGGFEEWKKKKKKKEYIDPYVVAEQKRQARLKLEAEQKAQEPPVSKPVDQVEHEKTWGEMSLFDKAKATGKEFLNQTLGEKGALGILEETGKDISEYEKTQDNTPYTPTKSVGKNLVGELGSRVENFSSDILSGLSGGQVNAPKIDLNGSDNNWVDKTVGVIGNAIGTVSALSTGEGIIGATGDKIPIISELGIKYPTFAKYASPIIKNAISFAGYGQLDPKLGYNYSHRLKKAGIDSVMSVPYTLLGFVKDFKKSVPASFMVGYGMAKLDGASNKDAIIAGTSLGLLDLYGRKGGESDRTLFAGKKVTKGGETPYMQMFRDKAISNIKKYSDLDISNSSSDKEIKKAIKVAERNTHPDLQGKYVDQTASSFKEVQNAKDFLLGKAKYYRGQQEQPTYEPTDVPVTREPQSPEAPKTETAKPAEAPIEGQPKVNQKSTESQSESQPEAPKEGAIKLLQSLDKENTEKATKIADSLSNEELKQTLDILTNAEKQASEEQKKSITQDKEFVQKAIKDREKNVNNAVGKTVFENKNEIDNLPEAQRKEAVDTLNTISKANHEAAPKAKKLSETIKKNNQVIEKKLTEVNKEKQELLKKKSAETEPTKKKQIQEKIDKVDDGRMALKEEENKADIYNVPAIDKQEFSKEPTEKFQITLDDGRKVNVGYEKDVFGGQTDRLEFRGMAISSTGYRSDFFGKLGKGESIKEVAKALAENFAKEEMEKAVKKARVEKREKNKQERLSKEKNKSLVKGNKLKQHYENNKHIGNENKRGELSGNGKVGESKQARVGEHNKENAGKGQQTSSHNVSNTGKRNAERQQLKPIRKLKKLNVTVPTYKTIYKGSSTQNIIKGKFDGKPFTTNKFILEFEDINVEHNYNASQNILKGVGDIIKTTEDNSIELSASFGYAFSYDNKALLTFKAGDENIFVDAKYYNYLAKKYKNLRLIGKDNSSPIRIYNDDKFIGFVMPFLPEKETITPFENEIKPVEKKTKANNSEKIGTFAGQVPKDVMEKAYRENEPVKITKKYTKAEIEKLVNSKDTFTEEEKKILRQYEGSGGQKEGSGRGVLDEYYTPKAIVDSVWKLVENNIGSEIKTVIEPSAGTGRFIETAPTGARVVGYETNPISAKIAGVLNPNAKIHNIPFEELFIDKKGNSKKTPKGMLDVVIGNPPYGMHRGLYKGLGEEPKLSKYEEYFLKRGLDMVKEDGVVAMVVPSGFLRAKIDYAKKEIGRLGALEDAYRLPNGVFGSTDVGTDIVIFKKNTFNEETDRIEPRVGIISNDQYFKDNPQKVLGVEGERKGRFGMEKYVKGNLEEAIKKMNIDTVVDERQAVEEFDDISKPVVEMEQPLTPEVKNEAIRKMRVAKKRKTKARKTGKNMEVKGVFKRDKKEPYKVLSTKKGNIKEFTQGKKLSKEEQKLYALTREDGTISGIELNDAEKKRLNLVPNQSYGDSYLTDFNYYQGDIYKKLEDLERYKSQGIIDDEHYNRQKKKLEESKSKKRDIKQITLLPIDKMAKEIKIGDQSLLDGFIEWIKDLPSNALEGSSRWEISDYLEGKPVRGGSKEQNKKERTRRRRVGNKLFKKYYTEELEASDQKKIVDKFNKDFNGYIKPDYSNYPLEVSLFDKFYGKPFEIRPIQMEGAAFLVNKGVGLLAYEVGVGKTLAGISAISEVMRKGWAEKPLVIVPKNLKTKWIRDITESMPNIKINDLANLGGAFKYKGKKEDLYIEPGSISVVTEDGFGRLGFSDKTYTDLTQNLQDVTKESGKKTKRAREQSKAKIEETMGMGRKKTDFPLTFEQLGFDHITIDEAHRDKNIFSKAKAKGIKGQTSNEYGAVHGATSARGLKTYLATQYVLGQNKGRNVFLLTATPFNNSPIEIYSMLSLMAKNRLERMGIKNINDFISLFCEIETKYAIKANGKVELTDQVKKFNNLQTLQKLVREYVDFRTGEEAGIPRPEKTKETPHLNMNKLQAEYVEKAQELFSSKSKKEGGTLQAITELQKITLSPYLSQYSDKGINEVSPKEVVDNSPKIKYTVEAIQKVRKVNPNAGQIIFAEKGIEVFRPIRDYFVKELGYPENEVAVIDGSITGGSDAKDDIQDKFQNGEIKILLASGVAKEGIDLQKNSTDLYNLWVQWNPTDMIQVEGRTWRQNSYYDRVRIHYPLVKNSVDPFVFQKLEEKASRLASVFSYKGDSLDVSDIDFEGMKFDLITDPVMKVEAKYEYDTAEIDNKIKVAKADIAFMERRTGKIKEIKDYIKEYTQYRDYAKKEDKAGDASYYGKKVTKKKAELKDEQEKLAKKGINADEVKKQIGKKLAEFRKLREKRIALDNNFGKEKAKAEKEKYSVMSGENNYDEMLAPMESKEFFTHKGRVSLDKLPDTMKSIPDKTIKDKLSIEQVKDAISKMKKNINPSIARRLVFNIVEEIAEDVNGKRIYSGGQFNGYTGIAEIARRQGIETVDESVYHEPGHYAWHLLTKGEKNEIKRYFDKFSLDDRRKIFGKKSNGEWIYDLYRADYGENDWDLIQETAVTYACKERLRNKKTYHKNRIIAFIQKLIEAFANLANRVSEKIFSKKYNMDALDLIRQVYDTRSNFFDERDFVPDKRELENYLVDFNVRPELKVQSVPLSDINLDDELFQASEDYRNGVRSGTLLPILLKKGENGKFDIIDGRHRLVEQVSEGKTDFLATFDDKVYRMYTDEEESLQEAKKIRVRAHTRGGSPVRSYTRMKMILDDQKEADKPLIKDGRISVFNLYKKVYTNLYEGKPPAMTTLEDKKLTTSMTKRAFTLGKRFSAKEIKENYKGVQKEIRNYIVKNIPPKNRGELLRAVINAKTKADVDIVTAKVDRMVEIAKGRRISEEKKQLMSENYKLLLRRGMTERKNGKEVVNSAMLKHLVKYISGDDRFNQKQLTMDELRELNSLAKNLTQDELGRIIVKTEKSLSRLDDILPDSLQGKEIVTIGDIEKSLTNKDITGGWFGLTNKNTFRAGRLVANKNEITRKIYDKGTTAERHFVDEFDEFQKKTKELYKEATGKMTKFRDRKTDEHIVDFLEGRKNEDDISGKELKFANYIINFYANSLPVMKPHKLRRYYFTHTKQNFLEKVRDIGFGGAVKEFFNEQFMTDFYKDLPPEIATNLQYIVANKVFNPYGLPRKGARYSQDLRKAFQKYARVYYMKKNFDSFFNQANEAKQLLPKNMRRYFDRMLQSAKGRPDGIDFHPIIKKSINLATTFEYVKGLGLNMASGLFNVAIGTVDNLANYGILTKESLLKGNKRYLSRKGFKLIKKYRVADQNITYEMTQIMQTIPGAVNKLLFFHFEMGEHWLRGTAFLSSLTKEEWKTGIVSDKRVSAIRHRIGEAQPLYGRFDSPVAGRTTIGKTMFMYMSWLPTRLENWMNWVTGAGRALKNEKGLKGKVIKNKDLGKLIRYMAVFFLFSVALKNRKRWEQQVEQYKDLFSIQYWMDLANFKKKPVWKDVGNIAAMFHYMRTQERYQKSGYDYKRREKKWKVYFERVVKPTFVKRLEKGQNIATQGWEVEQKKKDKYGF